MTIISDQWTLVHFTTLAGCPVTPSPRKCGAEFLAKLDAAFEDLWARRPWGPAKLITHMGAYVDRPDPQGTDRHAQGRAIDIGEIRWPDGRWISASHGGSAAPQIRARYLAVTAVFELHLGCVLNYWQPDGKHRSHWHLDDHREPGWSPAWKPSVRFLQAALRYVWGAEGLAIDGDFGPKTKAAYVNATGGPEDLTGGLGWPLFLEETARRGFGL